MRDYIREWSPALGRDMEVLRFGTAGRPLLAFPTSMGRFYQWEDFGLVSALEDRIEGGSVQVWCVDAVDGESWYASDRSPPERIRRHLQYERYLADEVVPRMQDAPVAVGPSFGALHAFLLALRRPDRVSGFIGLSGTYDTARWLDGYSDEGTYLTNPMAFIPGLAEEAFLRPLREMQKKVIATGADDANVAESIRAAGLLNEKGLGVTLDIWPGWAHDWPYWKEMIRRYV